MCGIDVLYCCVGGDPLNLTGVPADWLSRLMSSTNSSGVSNDTASRPGPNRDPSGVLEPQGSSKGSLDPWALALTVALPVLAVLVAVAAGAAAFVRRRRRRSSAAARQFKPFHDSSSGSRSVGGRGVLADWQGPPDQGSPAGWGAGTGAAGGSPALLAALLSSSNDQQATPSAAGGAAAGLDAAEKGRRVGFAAGSSLHPQQLAEWQLIHRQQQQAVGGSSCQHSQFLLQANSSAVTGVVVAEAAAASPRPQQFLRVLRPKVPSLPADVIAAAAKFARQQHLRQQASRSSGSGSDGRPGSPFAEASGLPFGEAGFCHQTAEDCADEDVR